MPPVHEEPVECSRIEVALELLAGGFCPVAGGSSGVAGCAIAGPASLQHVPSGS